MIDLTPIINEILVPLIGILLSVALAYGANYLRKKTGIDVDADKRKYLQDAIERALAIGVAKLKDAGHTSVKSDNDVVNEAAGYLLDNVPDAIAHFKLNDKLEDYLYERLLAKR